MSCKETEHERGWSERSWMLALSILLGAACERADSGAPSSANPGESVRRPNIVLIVIDTARADHFSCYGYGQGTTPNVDALAARGILFRNARSVAPWTLPSHMSMFTGLPPRDHGATWAAFSEPGDRDRHDRGGAESSRKLVEFGFAPAEPERMLGARLRAAGYRAYGFSPNPWVSRNHGFAEGFEGFAELWRKEERSSIPPRPRRARGTTADEQLHVDFQRTKSGAAVAAIERTLSEHPRGEPFFLFVNFFDSHFPYDPPASLRERFGGKTQTVDAIKENRGCEFRMIAGLPIFSGEELLPLYDADLATADHAVGELVRLLESAGVFEDALVVLTSDHGELLGEKGRYSHQLYVDEPLMHVPLIVKLPGGERAGTIVDDPLVSNIDVYATVLAAAGAEHESSDFSRDLASDSSSPRELLVGEYQPSRTYLDYLHSLNDAFDVEAHLPDRFVVYTPEFRTELVGRTAVETTPLTSRTGAGGGDRLELAAREAERALVTYLAARDHARSGKARISGEDAESIAELEALGYVGSEDPEVPKEPAPEHDDDRR